MDILLIEDDSKTARLIAKALREAGYEVEVACDGKRGLELALQGHFDLLVVDVMLPVKDGWSVVAELRKKNVRTAALFLTARDSIRDRVKGLEIGGDDYMVKPFAVAELRARIRSLLRRAADRDEVEMHLGDLQLDLLRNRATRSGKPIKLTRKEFLLLAHLVRSAGEVVTRSEIVERAWGIDFAPDTNVVDVVVRRLRAKIDEPFQTKLIHTVRGSGYVLRSE